VATCRKPAQKIQREALGKGDVIVSPGPVDSKDRERRMKTIGSLVLIVAAYAFLSMNRLPLMISWTTHCILLACVETAFYLALAFVLFCWFRGENERPPTSRRMVLTAAVLVCLLSVLFLFVDVPVILGQLAISIRAPYLVVWNQIPFLSCIVPIGVLALIVRYVFEVPQAFAVLKMGKFIIPFICIMVLSFLAHRSLNYYTINILGLMRADDPQAIFDLAHDVIAYMTIVALVSLFVLAAPRRFVKITSKHVEDTSGVASQKQSFLSYEPKPRQIQTRKGVKVHIGLR
jgi:hypothetical protein